MRQLQTVILTAATTIDTWNKPVAVLLILGVLGLVLFAADQHGRP
jgi:hypothetical protein